MKEIPLRGKKGAGLMALVDDEDYDMVIKYKWYATIGGNGGNTLYVKTSYYINGKQFNIYLHRLILGIKKQKIQVDHIDHDGLNCQRNNLRTCSWSENQCNQLPKKGYTSIYKGVSWNKKTKKWQAVIGGKKNYKYLGSFIDEIIAAKVYDVAAKTMFGSFALINFPENNI